MLWNIARIYLGFPSARFMLDGVKETMAVWKTSFGALLPSGAYALVSS